MQIASDRRSPSISCAASSIQDSLPNKRSSVAEAATSSDAPPLDVGGAVKVMRVTGCATMLGRPLLFSRNMTVAAASGQDFASYLAAHANPPELIVATVVLPEAQTTDEVRSLVVPSE